MYLLQTGTKGYWYEKSRLQSSTLDIIWTKSRKDILNNFLKTQNTLSWEIISYWNFVEFYFRKMSCFTSEKQIILIFLKNKCKQYRARGSSYSLGPVPNNWLPKANCLLLSPEAQLELSSKYTGGLSIEIPSAKGVLEMKLHIKVVHVKLLINFNNI